MLVKSVSSTYALDTRINFMTNIFFETFLFLVGEECSGGNGKFCV